MAEANSQGEIIRRYIYLDDKVVGVWQHDQFYAVHSDQRGAPEAISNIQGRTVWQAQMDPWGRAEIDADPDRDGQTFVFNLRLPGQIEDRETGTYYNYQRDYDPRTGRYLTPDPSGQAGGLNTYLYAKANPLRYSDPLGLAPISGIEEQDSSPSLYGSSITNCKSAYDDAIVAHSFLNQSDGSAAKLLYPTSVEQIREAWAGENSKKATITTYRPDLQSGNYNLSYDDLTADGIAGFGDLVINATGGAGDSYALSFNSTNTAEIESTLRRHFGKLINNNDVLAVQAALDMTPGALNVIDLTPLHEEIIARFYARLYGDERVIQAEGVVYEAEQRYNQLGIQYGWPSCQTGQSGRNNPPGCSELRSAKSRYESATQAYADVLADVHNEMINQGDLPALDALDGQREEVAELFVTALGIFVPLTLTDLAIDVGTMGLGKIKRIGKAIKAIGGGLGSRLGKMSDDVAKRVLAVRYPHFAQYGELIKHPNLLRYLDEADAGVWDGAVLKRLDEDLANGNLAEALNSHTALLDSWKKMHDLNADDVLRQNPGALEALSLPKGSRPDPSEYLSPGYIESHLAKFDEGAVRFTTDAYPTLGTTEAFVLPKSEFDDLMTKTGGDLSLIEKELALKEGALTGDDAVIAWIRKEDFGELKFPSGNEKGADPDLWIPGGKTASGGVSEAIIDLSNPEIPKILYPF